MSTIDSFEIENKGAQATRWSMLTEVVAKLVAPITNMLLARLLSPEAFGVVATVTMIVSFAEIFSDAGFQKYLIQHDYSSRDELYENANVAFWTNILIALFLWLMIAIFSEQLAFAVGSPGLGIVVVVASASLPLTAFVGVQMALFKRDFDFKNLFIVRLLLLIVPLVVTVPLAFLTHSYWALVTGTLLTNLLNACLLAYKSNWKPKLSFSFAVLRNMFSYSWWILLESVAVWLTTYVDTFIVGFFLDSYYLGIYKTSMVTVAAIMNVIVGAISAPMFSTLSRLKNDNFLLINTYLKFIRAIASFLIPLGACIWLYRELVTNILLGNQWGDAVDFVGLWGLVGSFCITLGTFCNGLYNAKGLTKLSFVSQVLHLVVLIPAIFIAAQISYEVLYVTRSVVRLELVLAQLVLMWIYFRIPPLDSFKNVSAATACTLFASLGCLVVQWFLPYQWEPIIGIPVFAVSYLLLMHFLSRGTLERSCEVLGIPLRKLTGRIGLIKEKQEDNCQ